MGATRLYILAVYGLFLLAATALALRSRGSASDAATGVGRKYPSYVALNLLFLAAIWLQRPWPVFPLFLLTMLVAAEGELIRTLRRIPGRRGTRTLLFGCGLYLPLGLIAFGLIWWADPTGNRAAFLYLTVAAHDAFAQLVGALAGRTQLAARISPLKTVEGALGGLVAATLLGAALAPAVGWPLGQAGILGFTCGAAALGGDLLASAWKRAAGVAAYGELLGPQGGVMDRVDGLLLAAIMLAVMT